MTNWVKLYGRYFHTYLTEKISSLLSVLASPKAVTWTKPEGGSHWYEVLTKFFIFLASGILRTGDKSSASPSNLNIDCLHSPCTHSEAKFTGGHNCNRKSWNLCAVVIIEDEEQSLKLYMRKGSHSSTSPSHLPGHIERPVFSLWMVRSVYLVWLIWLGAQKCAAEVSKKCLPLRRFEPQPLGWQTNTLTTRLTRTGETWVDA